MQWQTSFNTTTPEKGFRGIISAYTATGTITAGSIATASPVILATNSASANGYHVVRPATSTALVNNLLQGLVARVPYANPTYLDREQEGLAQCYGMFDGAIVQRQTVSWIAGAVLIPDQLQFLVPVTGPVTAAATGTAANVEVPAIGGLIYLLEDLASSSATATATAKVFIRCV